VNDLLKDWPKDKPDTTLIECLSGLSLSAAKRIGKMETQKEFPEFEKLKDDEFFEFLSVVLTHAHGRIARIREEKGIKGRAKRKPNKLKMKDGVLILLKKYGKLSQEKIAELMVSELKYITESTGNKWSRSVYQSGIHPLVQERIISKNDNEYYIQDNQK